MPIFSNKTIIGHHLVNDDCIKLAAIKAIKAVNHNQFIDNVTVKISEISIIVPAISLNASFLVMVTP
jgi:L-serine deaminase